MSRHYGVILIAGDHAADFREWASALEYRPVGPPRPVSDYFELYDMLREDREGLLGLIALDGWTAVLDLQMTLACGSPATQLSGRLKTRVFSAILEGTSSTYGFQLDETGRCRRVLIYQEGEVVKEVGAALDAEAVAFAPTGEPGEEWVDCETGVEQMAAQLATGNFEPVDGPIRAWAAPVEWVPPPGWVDKYADDLNDAS